MKPVRCAVVPAFILLFVTPLLGVDWPPISKEDLSMTSIAEAPGSPAVILLREQTDDNMNNLRIVFERIKILTEAGKIYATVELPSDRTFSITMLSGRTVHGDGSITAFEGKAFDKTVAKADGSQIKVKAFTLPNVEAGSVVDFRYSLRYMDFRVFPPEWEVQTDLFQRKAYFKFIPLQNRGYASVKLDHGQLASKIAWTPFLGNGAQPEIHTLPAKTQATVHDVLLWVDMTMNNVPPVVEEPSMPPASMLKWRVYFYYQSTLKPEDYWKDEGKFWNKDVEAFLEKNDGVATVLTRAISPADTPEQKIRKSYAFVAALKNESGNSKLTEQKGYPLEYRSPECIMSSGIAGLAASGVSGCVQSESSPVEEKSQRHGVKDVLQNGGTHNQLNRLFVAMVRAAGIPASLIWVPDRSHSAFLKDYLSTDQLDGEIAIVQLDGKDVFLDPGTKFCPYGILDWRYTSAMGLRQGTNGADFGETPASDYKQALTTRMANVSVDESGVLSGVVSVVFKGVAAMVRRQAGENSGAEGRKKILEDGLGALVREKGEIALVNAPDWEGAEAPLVAQFRVRIPYATAADKRLTLPQHLFQAGEKARLPAAERVNALDFRFPWQEADEVHIKIPGGMEIESLPPDDSVSLAYARYRVQQKRETADEIYSRRDFIMGTGLILPDKYKEVKELFDKVNEDDDRPALVKSASSAATAK